MLALSFYFSNFNFTYASSNMAVVNKDTMQKILRGELYLDVDPHLEQLRRETRHKIKAI